VAHNKRKALLQMTSCLSRAIVGCLSLCWGIHLEASTGILDNEGREIVLRGINMRVKNLFDVSFDDGRAPLEPIPPLEQRDLSLIKSMGFNVVRLPVNWSALEPMPGVYSYDYLHQIMRTLDRFAAAKLPVIIDIHQDAFSKEIGEDGAPKWAILPFVRNPNAGGRLNNLFAMRVSEQVQHAFADFWRNRQFRGQGLQEYYISAAARLWSTVHAHPAIMGIDIFNEPWLLHAKDLLPAEAGGDLSLDMLYQFYGKLIPVLQKIDAQKLIIFEPDIVKTSRGSLVNVQRKPYSAQEIPQPLPWNPKNTVYSPHLYTSGSAFPGTGPDFPGVDPHDPAIKVHFDQSITEARAFQAPLFLGEFGFQPRAKKFGAAVHAIYEHADHHLAHTALWVWKESSQESWGFFDTDPASGEFKFRDAAARAVVRAYPQAISGEILAIRNNTAEKTLAVDFRYRSTSHPHLLYVPRAYGFGEISGIWCNEKPVRPDKVDAAGLVELRCGERNGEILTIKIQGS
jgi:endoglycosylceramidase